MTVSTTPRRLRHLLLMALGQDEIGRRVREAREAAEMTQPDLAHAIGLKHPQSISNYERGLTEVPGKRLRRIAEATGKPMSFFVAEGEGGEATRADVTEVAAQIAAEAAKIAAESARIASAAERLEALLDGRESDRGQHEQPPNSRSRA